MSREVRAGHKDLRALARALRPGLHLESDGKAKVRIVEDDSGEVLRWEDGRPVSMANSPNSATVRITRFRLQRIGALGKRKWKGGR